MSGFYLLVLLLFVFLHVYFSINDDKGRQNTAYSTDGISL